MNQRWTIILFYFFSQSVLAQQKSKILPRSLQKAFIVQKMAIVYARPDFDSLQIAKIPYGKTVTISKKIFKAQRGFGTFYQIFLSNPRKIKAYISEVDVVGSQQKDNEGKWSKNPTFLKTKETIEKLENPHAINEFKNDQLPLLSKTRAFGLSTTHFWKGYNRLSKRVNTWFFNLQLGGQDLPIKNVGTDISFGFAISDKLKFKTNPNATPLPNSINKIYVKGYIFKLDFLLRFPVIDSSSFSFFAGLGVMAKIKVPSTSKNMDGSKTDSEIGGGASSLLSLHIRLNKKFLLLGEGRFYYDILEKKMQYGVGGGFLVSF